MTVYYAHPLSLYNTPQESRDLALLHLLGFAVVNPNSPEHEKGYRLQGMSYFTGLVHDCGGLAFRAFPDGSIPAGVMAEIKMATDQGKPVFELPTGVLRRGLSIELTREVLHDSGQR